MSSIRRFALLVAAAIAVGGLSQRAEAIENGHFVVNPASGFAADGFDPVAYFVVARLREGKPEFETSWEDAAWRFANEGNRDAFVREPLVYAPRFGGRCPVALARGYPAEGNPRIWAVYDNRLYFFYSEQNKLAFEADPALSVADAQATWDKLFPY
jgi:YHS domain-containing protein